MATCAPLFPDLGLVTLVPVIAIAIGATRATFDETGRPKDRLNDQLDVSDLGTELWNNPNHPMVEVLQF